jgi:hypothetical protein
MEFDPDPLVTGTDPRIRIRTKMSRIPNTEKTLCIGSLGDIQNAVIMSLSLSYQNMNVWNAP